MSKEEHHENYIETKIEFDEGMTMGLPVVYFSQNNNVLEVLYLYVPNLLGHTF